MTKVAAGITIRWTATWRGPDDGPGRGLGEGGERPHYWVFGGPWTYEEEPRGEATGADKEFLTTGSPAGARSSAAGEHYEAAGRGGRNPFGLPFFIVTHRPEDEPPDAGFRRERARRGDAAAVRPRATRTFVMGGADVIRQALRAATWRSSRSRSRRSSSAAGSACSRSR